MWCGTSPCRIKTPEAENPYLTYILPHDYYAAGVVASTVMDMAERDASFNTDKPLRKARLNEMQSPAKLNNGKELDRLGLGNIYDEGSSYPQ